MLTGSVLAGSAQPVQWHVEVGFDGHYTQDAWTPLRVVLDNRGNSRTGRVLVPVHGRNAPNAVTHSVPVELPQATRKSYRLIVPDLQHRQEVRLQAGGLRTAQRVSGAASAPEDVLMVVLSGGDSILGFLNGTPAGMLGQTPIVTRYSNRSPASGRFVVAHCDWGTLPQTWLGWDGADVAVVAHSDLGEADERELEALRLWVRLGGTLVVTGGTHAPGLSEGPLGEMLPIQARGTRTVEDLAPLEEWGGEPIARQAALIADGTRREDAEVLLGRAEQPLVLRRRLDAGTVLMTTFDFAAEPVRYWDGQQQMWSRLLSAGGGDGPHNQFLSLMGESDPYSYYRGSGVAGAAAQTEKAALPPLWLVIGFLVSYIVVLVPVNYWFVNRMNRRELAWLTTPAIILVFFGAAWGTGFALRGHQTLLNRVSVLETGAGQGVARAVGYAGIFSPAKMDYTMRLNGTAAAAQHTELGSGDVFTMQFGPQPTVRDLAVNMWSTRVVQVPFVADIGDGLAGQIEWNGSDLSATVRNDTGLDLEEVALMKDGRIGRPKKSPPGDQALLDFTTTVQADGFAPEKADLARRALKAVIERIGATHHPGTVSRWLRDRPCVVALCTEPILPVELVNRSARTNDATVIVARLPVRLSPMTGKLIPGWMVRRRIIATDTSGGGTIRRNENYGARMMSVEINNASVTWEFDVPEGPNGVQPTGLQLEMQYTGTPADNAIEAYDFARSQWRSIPTGGGFNMTLAPPERYMSPDGRVRVRVGGAVTVEHISIRARANAF